MSRGPGRRRGVFPRFSTSEDVDREIRIHLEMRAEELEEAGWDPAAARAEAERLFGDVEHVSRECVRITSSRDRAVERGRKMGELWQDIRYAARGLAKAPGFTAVALITLGLGIGANSAIFSVVQGVLLRPLPYERPDELVFISERSTRGTEMSAAWANFRDWRSEARSFDALAAYATGTTTVLGGAEPAWTTLAFVSEDFWRVFGVVPAVGRLTLPADHLEGAASVAVVTQSFADRILGGGDVVGRSVEAFGVRAQVVGVVPGSFDYPAGVELWVPMLPQGESRTAHNWSVVGRLAGGVRLESAAEEVDAIMSRIAASSAGEPSEYLAVGTISTPLHTRLVGDARRPLFILLGAAGFVLLVACTNMASTLLARGTTRAPELAVRTALGASRGRLLRQLLAESLVLAVGGGALGLAFAGLAIRVIRLAGAGSVPRLEAVGVDAGVLGFTLAAALLTAVAFGLLPALRATKGGQAAALRSGRGNAAVHGRTWSVLVSAEVALAMILLVGSGLLVRSFVAVLAEDGGFDPDDVVATTVALSGAKYPTLHDQALLWDDLLERVQAAPGVSAAGLTTSPPLGRFAPNGRIAIDGDPNTSADAVYVVASPGTFAALDVALLQGRNFQESDGPDAAHVVVVSRSFAERYWPGLDPLGRQVTGGGMDDHWDADPPAWGTVVGVVADVRLQELTRSGEPTVYWHYKQRPYRTRFGATLLVEAASGDPASVVPALRGAVRAADPDVAVPLRYLSDMVSDSVAERRFLLLILASFAGIALILAGVGIYGVVSYAVARRTREMGIRLALGAAPTSVRAMVLRGAMQPVSAGLVVGTFGGLVLTRFLGSLLYEVPPTDPLTFTLVPLLLLAAALLASWAPARRGTRVDPVRAMRAE